jgi:hypothetical protein
MNSEPHMHRVEMRDYSSGNTQRIGYGDSRVLVYAFCFGRMPSAWRISRGVKKVIKRHDKGSQKHVKYQASLDKVNSHLVEKRTVVGHLSDGSPMYSSYSEYESPPIWGIDLLTGKIQEEATK